MTPDIAGELHAAPLPVPTSQRRNVFVAAGDSEEMLESWQRWAGETNFKWVASRCGTAIFSWHDARIPASLADKLRPFFDSGGGEAAVFEYKPVGRYFVRRMLEWLNTPGRVVNAS